MTKNDKLIIKATDLSKSFQLKKIFENISFDIKNGDRIGLVGYNGTGKTTLANILTGKLLPDEGTIEKVNNLTIGTLSQSIDYEVSDFQQSLTSEKDLLHYSSELGLTKVHEWEDFRLNHLSGGEKLKLSLSMVWASKPGFLILDEPTNHLDYKGIEWLISELEKFQGPVLIISHDRHFLDKTVNRIFEIENGNMQFYNGNYSEYQQEKQHRVQTHWHQYNVQQRIKEDIQRQMTQLSSWSDKAHRTSMKEEGFKEYHRVKAKKRDKQVKSKMKRLAQELEKNKIEKPLEDTKVRFQFENNGKRGKRIIEAKSIYKKFGNRTLINDCQFYINKGERVGLIGGNGCGKTTLIKMILGDDTDFSGELWRSDTLKISYLSQDVDDLPGNKNAIEALGYTDRDNILRARTYFANLGLQEEYITKPIDTLSLGERTRVKLVDMLMREYDVLILDEPTNHLDLPSREQLETTLSEFTGTIITVSHDFYFLNKLCEKLLVFENGRIRRLEMKPEEYFNKPDTLDQKQSEEDLMIIENRIASILGELSLLASSDQKYQKLDQEFKELIKLKRDLIG
jgi:macrolide transport system ATP-binding/permease protein